MLPETGWNTKGRQVNSGHGHGKSLCGDVERSLWITLKVPATLTTQFAVRLNYFIVCEFGWITIALIINTDWAFENFEITETYWNWRFTQYYFRAEIYDVRVYFFSTSKLFAVVKKSCDIIMNRCILVFVTIHIFEPPGVRLRGTGFTLMLVTPTRASS